MIKVIKFQIGWIIQLRVNLIIMAANQQLIKEDVGKFHFCAVCTQLHMNVDGLWVTLIPPDPEMMKFIDPVTDRIDRARRRSRTTVNSSPLQKSEKEKSEKEKKNQKKTRRDCSMQSRDSWIRINPLGGWFPPFDKHKRIRFLRGLSK